jgi:carboxylate-amine ligase
MITDVRYLSLFDIEEECSAGEIWEKLYKRQQENISVKHQKSIEFLLENGSLSTRILEAVGDDFSEEHLKEVYNRLGTCLAENKLFKP